MGNTPGISFMAIVCICAVMVGTGLKYTDVYGAAEQGEKDSKTSMLFSSHEPLSLQISAPFQTLHRYRGIERPYHDASMYLVNNAGEGAQVNLAIRVRGKFRAKRETCTYPPLKLNFKRKSLTGTVFEGENNLKLVTQCKDADRYAQYLLLEYLNYRVYQLFTDHSLRVRLAYITYHDTENSRDLGTRPAYFIEDIGRMARRNGLREMEVETVAKADYDQELINLVDVFEYFIGNTDWSAIMGPEGEDCCHNIIPMRRNARSLLPVPYDFDLAGVVNAPYAVVNDMLPIKNVRQRLYRGFCTSDETLQATLAKFADKREEITALYNNQKGLTEKSVTSALDYYADFYDTIQNSKKLKKEILDKCR